MPTAASASLTASVLNGLIIASIFFTAQTKTRIPSASKWAFPAVAGFTCAQGGETILQSAEPDAGRRGSIAGNHSVRQQTNPPPRDVVLQTNCARIRTIRGRDCS